MEAGIFWVGYCSIPDTSQHYCLVHLRFMVNCCSCSVDHFISLSRLDCCTLYIVAISRAYITACLSTHIRWIILCSVCWWLGVVSTFQNQLCCAGVVVQNKCWLSLLQWQPLWFIHTIYNVSLIVLKHYLLDFNWYQAIIQCTRTVNVWRLS